MQVLSEEILDFYRLFGNFPCNHYMLCVYLFITGTNMLLTAAATFGKV